MALDLKKELEKTIARQKELETIVENREKQKNKIDNKIKDTYNTLTKKLDRGQIQDLCTSLIEFFEQQRKQNFK